MKLQTKSFFSKFYGDKQFVKKMMKLFVPTILQTLISVIVLYVDNFSLAILIENKEEATAAKNALGLAAPIINLLSFIMLGWFGGISVMMAQYYGNNEKDMTRKTTAFKIWSSLVLMLPLIAVVSAMPGKIINVSSGVNGGRDFDLSKTYLWITGFTFIPYAIAAALSFSLQETKRPGISFIAAGAGMVTNIILDPIMITVCKDVETAVALVAMSTGIARIVQAVFIIIYIIVKKDRDIAFFNEWKIKLQDLKKIIWHGASTFINDIFFGISITILMVCLLRFNTEIHTATTNVLMMIELISVIWPGMATASSILVGSELGKGNIQQAKDNANKMLAWGFTFSLSTALILFVAGFFINPILSPSASIEMNHLATYMLWALLPIITCQGVYSVTYYSIKSGGSKITLLMDALVMVIWLILMCSVTFTGVAEKWNPIGYIFLLESYQIVKMIISLFIYKYYDWAKVLVNIETENKISKIYKESNL